MFVKSAAGRRVFTLLACLLLCVAVAFNAVSCIGGGDNSEAESPMSEVSLQEESEENMYAEFEAQAEFALISLRNLKKRNPLKLLNKLFAQQDYWIQK